MRKILSGIGMAALYTLILFVLNPLFLMSNRAFSIIAFPMIKLYLYSFSAISILSFDLYISFMCFTPSLSSLKDRMCFCLSCSSFSILLNSLMYAILKSICPCILNIYRIKPSFVSRYSRYFCLFCGCLVLLAFLGLRIFP